MLKWFLKDYQMMTATLKLQQTETLATLKLVTVKLIKGIRSQTEITSCFDQSFPFVDADEVLRILYKNIRYVGQDIDWSNDKRMELVIGAFFIHSSMMGDSDDPSIYTFKDFIKNYFQSWNSSYNKQIGRLLPVKFEILLEEISTSIINDINSMLVWNEKEK